MPSTVVIKIPTWERRSSEPETVMAPRGVTIYIRQMVDGQVIFTPTDRFLRPGVIHDLDREEVAGEKRRFSLLNDGHEQFWVKTSDVQ